MDAREWSYSGDPTNSTRDNIRFLVDDTNPADKLLTDAEVDYCLGAQATTLLAAVQAAGAVLAKFSRLVSQTISKGDEKRASTSYSDRAKQYREHVYDVLVSKAGGASAMLPIPESVFVGGASKADKTARRQDDDRVQTQFNVDMFTGYDLRSDTDNDEVV